MRRLPDNTLIICAGVSGCGKSMLARHLAEEFEAFFLEADDFHPLANIKRMAAGRPLTDAMRDPWIKKLLSQIAEAEAAVILACSALKKTHRDQFRSTGRHTTFLHLDGPCDLIKARLQARQNHFMPENLLQSQFDALEPMTNEKNVITLNVAQSKNALCKQAEKQIRQAYGL